MIATESGKRRQRGFARAALVCVFVFAGCDRPQSLVQQRLHEWLPRSATDVVSKSSGHSDDTTFITFHCSHTDLLRLREKFAAESKASWKKAPFDRRTAEILKLAVEGLAIESKIRPRADQVGLECLVYPAGKTDLPEGEAMIIDPQSDRVWYLSSTM